jgi:glucose-1-phosphatase
LEFSKIRNIIFDLGAVIINIDFQYTFEAFAKLAGTDILSIIKRFEEKKIFLKYETGELTDKELRDLIRLEFGSHLSDPKIDGAWNALLQDIPLERINLLQQLRKKYNLYLLSNTNPIHIRQVNEILYDTCGLKDLHTLFDKVYFSYEMRLAKPSVTIYKQVLKEQGLKAEETLFLDDNKDNIEGAKKTGIKTILVEAPNSIIELLENA